MSGSCQQSGVRCPFYTGDYNQRINCEGLVENSCITLFFRRRADYEERLNRYCRSDYNRCEICRMLMREKYNG